jgi:hypothetical protein
LRSTTGAARRAGSALGVVIFVGRRTISLRRAVVLRGLTAGTRGTQFVAGEFPVLIGVELGEGLGGILEFLIGDGSVAVGIEGVEDRGGRWSLALPVRLSFGFVAGIIRGVPVAARPTALGILPVAGRVRRTHFLAGQFPVTIFVELGEGPGGPFEFVFRDHAVLVAVEGLDLWGDGGVAGARGWSAVLGDEGGAEAGDDGQRQNDGCRFHESVWFGLVSGDPSCSWMHMSKPGLCKGSMWVRAEKC